MWVGKKRQSYLMFNLAALFLRPRGRTFKMTKWRSDTLSGEPGGWKGWAITQTRSEPDGIRGWGDERLWEMGMANVIIRPSLSPPCSHFFSFSAALLFCCASQINTPTLAVSLGLCVIWSGKPGPLSPVGAIDTVVPDSVWRVFVKNNDG